MSEEEIIKKINQTPNIEGMTVNERIFLTGLWDEYELALKNNKTKAKRILELLKIDDKSIKLILK